jgi:hypothetical protein
MLALFKITSIRKIDLNCPFTSHERILYEGKYSSAHSTLYTRWRWMVSHTLWPLYSQYPTNRMAGEGREPPGSIGMKIPIAPLEIRNQTHPPRNLVTILTTLSTYP